MSDFATSSASALLTVDGVSLAYGKTEVVHSLSFELNRGNIACLLGPSGCGKTTMLRAIAGLEKVTGGKIVFAGQTLSDPRTHIPTERRNIGMVFQDYALFPHLDVARNIGFGLRKSDTTQRQARVEELLDLVGLRGLGGQFPHQLSGGQQQRVALARALAPHPELILLDEPFSNLDVELRERLSLEVREILKAAGTTAILVTHDQQEAFSMADEIGVMYEGRIQQWDSAYHLYHQPINRFVADFIGQGVFLPGTVRSENTVEVELGMLTSQLPVECGDDCPQCADSCHVEVLLRPDDIVHDDNSLMQAEVVHKAFRGAEILYTLRLKSGARVLSLVPSHHNHALGENIGIRLDVDHVVTFHRPQ